jgi:outer membrane receptor for ferric coprogen and ferric-rhodotorulic acid
LKADVFINEEKKIEASVLGLATSNQSESGLKSKSAQSGQHTKRNFRYGKELCLLVGGRATARHEERWTSTKKQRGQPVFA